MHDKLIIPKVIVLAVACYYAISACRGRIHDLVGSGKVRWVYRSEQPAKFWACTLGWAITFATVLLMLHYNNPSAIKNHPSAIKLIGALGFGLDAVIFIWINRKL